MRVLVTGGAGFVGAHVVDRLLRKGARVGVLDNFSTGSWAALEPAAAAGLRSADISVADLRDASGAAAVERWRPGIVVHLAAQARVASSVRDPVRDAQVNIVGTIGLLAAAQRCGVRALVFASSGGTVYGQATSADAATTESHRRLPISPYGLSKATADSYLRIYRDLYGLPSMSLALGNVYGPGRDGGAGSGVIGRFVDDLLAGTRPTVVGDGRQTRDFVHVADVAEAFALACAAADAGPRPDAPAVVNIGSGVATSVVDVFEIVRRAVGSALTPVHRPHQPGEVFRNCLDPALAMRTLGWAPRISLADGVRGLVDTVGAAPRATAGTPGVRA